MRLSALGLVLHVCFLLSLTAHAGEASRSILIYDTHENSPEFLNKIDRLENAWLMNTSQPEKRAQILTRIAAIRMAESGPTPELQAAHEAFLDQIAAHSTR